MDDLNPDQFRLGAAQHKAIFQQNIKPRLFSAAAPTHPPIAIVFGGQPGAGKSAAVGLACQELSERGGAVEIIGDDLRQFHPHYASLVEQDDKTAAFYTDRDTGSWIEMAIAEATQLGISVVIEGTMRDQDKVAATLKALRAAGFEVDARALAVHHCMSVQGILMRYEGQKQDRGWARMTTDAAHQAGFDGLPITLARIEAEKLSDRISVMRRGGEVIYTNQLANGAWWHPPRARSVLEEERQRPLTLEELTAYVTAYENLLNQIRQPERQAEMDEVYRVQLLLHAAYSSLADALSDRLQMAKFSLEDSAKSLAIYTPHAPASPSA